MQIKPEKKRPIKIGDVCLSWPDFVFILLSNAAVIVVIINAVLNESGFWCYYPILGFYYAYAVLNAAFAGNAKKFLAKFRTGVFTLNTVFTVIALIHYFCTGIGDKDYSTSPLVAYEWVLPIILIISLIVVFVTAFFKTVSLLNLLVATSLMLPQVTGVFIFAVANHSRPGTIYSTASFVLSVVMFALYLMVIANLAFLHIVKVRNKIDDAIQKSSQK